MSCRAQAEGLAQLKRSDFVAARAQEVLDASSGTTPASSLRSGIGIDRPYWSAGEPRAFVAGVFETGGVSLRTELDVGYGQPHYAWAGLEVSSSLSLRGVTMYSGGRVALPFGHIRAGARYFAAVNQKLLAPQAEHERWDLDVDEGRRSRYVALDGELFADIPLPAGKLGLLGAVHGVFGPPPEFHVYEEGLRAIIKPPLAWRGRASYLVGVGEPATLRVGGLLDVYGNPEREAVWLRTGPAVAVSLTHHLEAVGVAAFTFLAPDEIGLAGADLGQIGLRYRWATGDPWPEFP